MSGVRLVKRDIHSAFVRYATDTDLSYLEGILVGKAPSISLEGRLWSSSPYAVYSVVQIVNGKTAEKPHVLDNN